jgi:hypothetical protein
MRTVVVDVRLIFTIKLYILNLKGSGRSQNDDLEGIQISKTEDLV